MVRAAVLRAYGEPLEVVDLELDDPAPDQVRVRVEATGVCHSDLSAREGTMAWGRPPMVLGHEGAGVVVATGADVTRVREGDHVVVAWNQPCRACDFCRRGEVHLCSNATPDVLSHPYATLDGEKVVPFLGAGTFAEETLLLERSVVPIDPALPLDTAALVGCAVATGVGAVRNTARVMPGSSVAVIGCGAVGLSVVQGAKLAGATTIVAVDVVPSKLQLAEQLGATHTVDASKEDTVKGIKAATGGADYVFEVLGRSQTIRQAYEAARRGGTAVVVGVGSRHDEVTFNAMELFFLAKTVIGCVYGSTDPDRDFPRLLEYAVDGQLDLESLITDRIELADVDGALDAMARGEGLRSVVELGGA